MGAVEKQQRTLVTAGTWEYAPSIESREIVTFEDASQAPAGLAELAPAW